MQPSEPSPTRVSALSGATPVWRLRALTAFALALAYVATGFMVLGIGLVLGRLAARFETSGGPYLYIERAYGPLAGFQVGWLFWLARTRAQRLAVLALSGYVFYGYWDWRFCGLLAFSSVASFARYPRGSRSGR